MFAVCFLGYRCFGEIRIAARMDRTNTRVLIISCEEGPGAWWHQSEMLRQAFPKDDPSLTLVDNGDDADVILIADLRDRYDWFRNLREHPLVKKYPDRCFTVGEDDKPGRWVRGMQTSIKRSAFNFNRFHSGSYTLFHPDFLNPYVRAAAAQASPPDREKKFLFAFTGRACIPLRRRLFETHFYRPDILVKNTTGFHAFTHDQSGRDAAARNYFETMLACKFALCPRGLGTSSIRLFEAMSLGIAPIIISDAWVPPLGPKWEEFALFVKEDALDQIEPLAIAHEGEWRERGRGAREAYEQFFATEGYVRYLVEAALDLQRRQIIPERWVHRLWPIAINYERVRRRVNQFRKRIAERRGAPQRKPQNA
jgi:hypothetical protein